MQNNTMNQDKLNLKQIAVSVFKHIQRLPTDKIFGTIKIKLQKGKPHQATFEESVVEEDIK